MSAASSRPGGAWRAWRGCARRGTGPAGCQRPRAARPAAPGRDRQVGSPGLAEEEAEGQGRRLDGTQVLSRYTATTRKGQWPRLQAAPPSPKPWSRRRSLCQTHTLCTPSLSRCAQARATSPTPSSLSASLGVSGGPRGVVCSQRNSRGGIKKVPRAGRRWQVAAPMPSLSARPSGLSTPTRPPSPPQGAAWSKTHQCPDLDSFTL